LKLIILENYTYDLPWNRLKDEKNIYEINNLNQITNISNSWSENISYLYDNNWKVIWIEFIPESNFFLNIKLNVKILND